MRLTDLASGSFAKQRRESGLGVWRAERPSFANGANGGTAGGALGVLKPVCCAPRRSDTGPMLGFTVLGQAVGYPSLKNATASEVGRAAGGPDLFPRQRRVCRGIWE